MTGGLPVRTGVIDWDSLEAVIFDLDGTLYRQSGVRLAMARQLVWHCLSARDGIMSVQVLRTFRACREELAEREACGVGVLQYEVPAQRLGIEAEHVRGIVEDWIETRPLASLLRHRRPGVCAVFSALRTAGKRVIVYSDYPVSRKLSALGLEADLVVCGTDPGIDRFKPNPAGLAWIQARTGLRPQDCLVIGDRPDRDGEAARRAGLAYLQMGRSGSPQVVGCPDFRHSVFAPLLQQSTSSRDLTA